MFMTYNWLQTRSLWPPGVETELQQSSESRTKKNVGRFLWVIQMTQEIQLQINFKKKQKTPA